MPKRHFFDSNKKVVYLGIDIPELKTLKSILEKENISLCLCSTKEELEKFDKRDILSFIVHFNWGETLLESVVPSLAGNLLFFILYDKSSRERKKAFLWGGKENFDLSKKVEWESILNYLVTYKGNIDSYRPLRVALFDDSKIESENFLNFLKTRGLGKNWKLFHSLNDWKTSKEPFDIFLIDLFLGSESGLDLIEEMRKDYPEGKFYAISNSDTPEILKKCKESGFIKFFKKTNDFNLLMGQLLRAKREEGSE